MHPNCEINVAKSQLLRLYSQMFQLWDGASNKPLYSTGIRHIIIKVVNIIINSASAVHFYDVAMIINACILVNCVFLRGSCAYL